MERKKIGIEVLFLLVLIFVSQSCQKDLDDGGEIINEDFIEITQDNIHYEMIEANIEASMNDAIAYFESLENLKSTSIGECATIDIAYSNNSFPVSITIDFGDGCTTFNGMDCTGTMFVTLSDTLRKQGTTYHVTFQNFLIDDGHSITGEISGVNQGLNASGYWKFYEESSFDIVTPEGEEIEKERNLTRVWVAGSETNALSDDVFECTGYGELTSLSEDWNYSYTIQESLIVSPSCSYILGGVMELSWSNIENTFWIDFEDEDNVCNSEFRFL